jgi:hypothetical protein
MEVKNAILDSEKNGDNKRLYKDELNPEILTPDKIVSITYDINTFMLKEPEIIKKKNFPKYKLGKIISSLRREDLYKDK